MIHHRPRAADALQALFRENGDAPETAGDARSGHERARALRPSLIALDPLLPDGTALELLRGLQAEEALRGVPVLLLPGADPLTERDPGAERVPEAPAALVESPARPEHVLAAADEMLAAAGVAGVDGAEAAAGSPRRPD